jgi:transcriptional regulator with PAS, ATPase and Fis domain
MASSPSLVVQALSDSFGGVWDTLASEAGLPLRIANGVDSVSDMSREVVVLAAAGEEAKLADAARSLADCCGSAFAAVVADADYRLTATVLRAGADQLFVLPPDLDLLRSWIVERAQRIRVSADRTTFAAGEVAKYRFEGIFGTSAALSAALERAARIIPHASVTVLLTGETGTGKELFARAIHYNGPRREAPFVDVNCAALPEHLLESELFGHEKGAFTDASVAKPGLFEMADGGSIFLDEFGHLALPLQGKLLRALQERVIRRVGGTRAIPIDVRIIAATHVNLEEAVRRGEFRQDLYYRLNVVPIVLPPLRQRRDDIVPLAQSFVQRFASEYGVPRPTLTAQAQRALVQREWLGNIRELRNVIERAVLLGGAGTLDANDFEFEAPGARPTSEIPFPATLDAMIAAAAARTMDLCAGNKSEVARILGISRTRLQRILDGHADHDAEADEPSRPRLVRGGEKS